MSEIAAIPHNGFNVVSTFSGCGGSCTGYRMAGFKVLWANEFVPAAQDSYRANMEAGCILDPRDIKTVTATEILNAIGLPVGGLDLLDGSPPCQAFSTAGKREKGWGHDKTYEHGARQKNETLFTEYIRLVQGLQPKVFVAENVSGLVKGTAKGYFLEILAGLKACGYQVKAKLLDAQWLGVPQTRQRIIFMGVRNDLGLTPVYPKPLPYRYSVRDALPWIVSATAEKHGPNSLDWITMNEDAPAPAVPTTNGGGGFYRHSVEARVIHDTSGLFSQGDVTDKPCPTITVGVNSLCASHFKVETAIGAYRDDRGIYGNGGDMTDAPAPTVIAGAAGTHWINQTATEKRKFTIAEVKRICAFPDDFILTGSYAQQWERLGNSVPPVMMYQIARVIRDEILRKQQ
jgi:DNA (cytosine-5)-methyltransferase 1